MHPRILIVGFLLYIGRFSYAQNTKELFDTEKVSFFLNRLQSSNLKLSTSDPAALKASQFHPQLHTIVFTHGYAGHHLGAAARTVKDGFLSATDANVILVDHQFYSYPYMRLFKYYRDIGKTIGNFINFLVDEGELNLSNLTIIGHSFGAHISAIAANNVKGQVERIIGLDPAGPHFHNLGPEDRLSADDATDVRCMHTSPVLGISEPICQINYYVNGGELQPSCVNDGENEILFGTCSHNVPMEYLSRVISNASAFPASVCMSASDAKSGKACSRSAGGFMEFPLESRSYLPGSFYVPVP